jgi:hypothetical protein
MIRDVVLPADTETVAVPLTDTDDVMTQVEALPGGRVIAVSE